RILVVLGNPPYDGYAALALDEERKLTDAYRAPRRAEVPRPQGQGLNDLYVRFFRVAERQIAERTGRGLVCLVTNGSWLDGLSHTAMRERFLDAFDGVWVDNLHGDKYRTGKLTPAGEPDPSVFSTRHNREGIQVGTAVALLARTDPHEGARAVRYRDFWGKEKLRMLGALADEGALAGLGVEAPEYVTLVPEPALGLPFVPREVGDDYLDWPSLPDLFPASFPGVKTSRDEALVDVDLDSLKTRMAAYFAPEVSDAEAERIAPRLMVSTRRFDATATRRTLQRRGINAEGFVRYLYRPFDVRWLYWDPDTKLLD